MVLEKKQLTAADFDEFIQRPENVGKEFEFICGEIVDIVPNPVSSKIGARMTTFIGMYLLQHDSGHLTGADGGYVVGESERYIPDVGYISYEKQPELSYENGYIPNAPDLAVEVVSPGNTDKELLFKIGNYIEAGTVVWVLYPQTRQVVIYQKGEPLVLLSEDNTLDGGSVLPDFSLKVSDIFG